jgi:hypothetical protein
VDDYFFPKRPSNIQQGPDIDPDLSPDDLKTDTDMEHLKDRLYKPFKFPKTFPVQDEE